MRLITLLLCLTVTSCDRRPDEITPPPVPAPAAPELDKAFRLTGPFVKPIREPGPSDWLAQHEEEGQTFQQWVDSKPNIPNAKRRTIYLQPIGAFEGARTVDLDQLQRFTQTFFQLPVVVREPIPVEQFPTREHQGQTQIKTGDVLTKLREIVPDDAYCMLAVTMTDLYPRESWNFVFGVAYLKKRVGVFSFARYSPDAEELTPSQQARLTERAFKVLSHEAGHMFGINHCTALHCGMNGSNSLSETDGSPLPYCPICLRKLQSAVGFDVAERDAALAELLDEVELWQHASWYRERREWLLAPD